MAENIVKDLEVAKELFGATKICKAEEMRTDELKKKQEKNELTVAVIGQFKRGKSTLVNAMLEENILPVGIVPVTSVVTKIEYGEEKIKVFFDRGNVEEIEAGQLAKYVNEQENPDNKQGVLSIGLNSKAEFLKEGLVLVDTPGVGSVHKHNTDAAYAFVKESDGIIFLLSVDSPINEIEIEFLKNAKEFASKFYFVVNKIDNISEEELSEYMSYCNTLLCAILDTNGINLLPVSAKKKQGIDKLKNMILTDLRQTSKQILEQSAKKKLLDLTKTALSKLRLYTGLLRLPSGKLAVKYEQIKEFCDELRKKNAKLAERLPKLEENSDNIQLAKALSLALNDTKIDLAKKVMQVFEMEYFFELSDMEILEKYRLSNARGDADEVAMEFLRAEENVRNELLDILNSILMHKENNTITISRNLGDLNRIYRNLRSLKAHLEV